MIHRRLALASRKDLLWSIAAFVLVQLGLAIAIEYRLPQVRDPYYAYRAERLVRRTVAVTPRPLTVVVLGSSRIQNGLKSHHLEEQLTQQLGRPVVVFNFGIPGSGPVTNLLHWKRLRAEGVRPDVLFVEVVPPHLSGHLGQPIEAGYMVADRLSLAEITDLGHYGFPVDSLQRDWWHYEPVPCYFHRFKIMSRWAPGFLPSNVRLDWARHVDDSGWQEPIVGSASPEARKHGLEVAWVEHALPLQRFQLGGPSCQALRDMLALCRAEGIPTAMLLMPEGTIYRSWYPPQVVEQIQTFLDGVSREFAAPVIDAHDWVADDGFSDGHHLQHNGAAVFTERFCRDVLLPTLQYHQGPPVTFPMALGMPKPGTIDGPAPALGSAAGLQPPTILVKRPVPARP